MSTSESFFAIVFFGGMVLFIAWITKRGLRTGQASMRGDPIERATQPRLFWTAIALQCLLGLVCAGAVIKAVAGLVAN